MKVNGEAIYSTRPLAPYREGKLCYTQGRSGSLYVIYLADENEKGPPPKIWISSMRVPQNASVTLLGNLTPLKWEMIGNGILVEIPEALQTKPPCENAWVVKVSKARL
jgi:alpha-L-fucosidase